MKFVRAHVHRCMHVCVVCTPQHVSAAQRSASESQDPSSNTGFLGIKALSSGLVVEVLTH